MGLLVVRHDEAVGLGGLAEPLAARALPLAELDATTDDLGDPADHDGILVLGGRMSVAGPLEDWAQRELGFLQAADVAAVPVFGICLGSQLLALAHGGDVATREEPEAAIVAVHRTALGREHDIAAGWPDGAPGIAHHNDEVVRLPDGADQLLLGSDGPTLWCLRASLGTQLHPEIGVETLEDWLDAGLVDTDHVDVEALRDRARAADPFLRAAGISLVLRWVDSLETA